MKPIIHIANLGRQILPITRLKRTLTQSPLTAASLSDCRNRHNSSSPVIEFHSTRTTVNIDISHAVRTQATIRNEKENIYQISK